MPISTNPSARGSRGGRASHGARGSARGSRGGNPRHWRAIAKRCASKAANEGAKKAAEKAAEKDAEIMVAYKRYKSTMDMMFNSELPTDDDLCFFVEFLRKNREGLNIMLSREPNPELIETFIEYLDVEFFFSLGTTIWSGQFDPDKMAEILHKLNKFQIGTLFESDVKSIAEKARSDSKFADLFKHLFNRDDYLSRYDQDWWNSLLASYPYLNDLLEDRDNVAQVSV